MHEDIWTPPQCVIDRFAQLRALCEKYPVTVPLTAAAKFLGVSPECLRESIITGSCHLALAGKKLPEATARFAYQRIYFTCAMRRKWLTKHLSARRRSTTHMQGT